MAQNFTNLRRFGNGTFPPKRYAIAMKLLASIAPAVAIGLLAVAFCIGPAGAQQTTFWTLSSGKAPAPLPTPSSYPVNLDGTPYYPSSWPVCSGAPNRWSRHCRPPHGQVWPPRVPPGRYPIPLPPGRPVPGVTPVPAPPVRPVPIRPVPPR
jgi:hypothetical protein